MSIRLLLPLINGIFGAAINDQTNYGTCDDWNPLIISTGFDVGTNCCDTKGIECQDSKVKSIDITVNSTSAMDLTKLPKSINLEKYSIKGDIYKNALPAELLNSQLYKILDLSHSTILTIPNNIEENTVTEEIYLNNNQINSIPIQFKNIKNLRVLNLEYNNITDANLGITCSSRSSRYSYSRYSQYDHEIEFSCDYSDDPESICDDFPNVESLSLENNLSSSFMMNKDYDFNFNCKEVKSNQKSIKTLITVGIIGIILVIVVAIASFIITIRRKRKMSSRLSIESDIDYRREVNPSRQNYDLPNYNDACRNSEQNTSSRNDLGLPSYEEAINSTDYRHNI